MQLGGGSDRVAFAGDLGWGLRAHADCHVSAGPIGDADGRGHGSAILNSVLYSNGDHDCCVLANTHAFTDVRSHQHPSPDGNVYVHSGALTDGDAYLHGGALTNADAVPNGGSAT